MTNNTLRQVDPQSIAFDVLNPRGESIEQITSDPEFYKLKDSIKTYGLINPLIIRAQESKEKPYLLIDGERRLRAVLDLKLSLVNVNIIDNEVDGNIIAYQIHQNRKKWEKPSEAKSIKRIITSIRTEDPSISEPDLKRKLIEITSHKPNAIDDMLKMLRYSDEIVEKSQKGEIEHSYLIRIEDDFTQPLIKSFPQVVKELGGENKIREIMVEKAQLGLLKNTRYMMTSGFKEIFQETESNDAIIKKLITFLNLKSQSVESLYEEFKNLQKESSQPIVNSELTKSSSTNAPTEKNDEITHNDNISTPKLEPISNESTPQNNIITTSNEKPNSNIIKGNKAKTSDYGKIKGKYESLYLKFSEEESEYLREAFECLGTQKCMKAATLMIWATTISRILYFIGKDINQFNTACNTMNKEKKSFYKNYAGNFQTKATDIDQIRETAKDMQLLCFLCYEKVITPPNLKKLKAIYDKRNDCAHPTSVVLSLTEVVVVFEQLYDIIFNNSKLK